MTGSTKKEHPEPTEKGQSVRNPGTWICNRNKKAGSDACLFVWEAQEVARKEGMIAMHGNLCYTVSN